MLLQVRWWDVAAGEQLFRLEGHTDYVRSAAANPASPDVWATGGYDHVCRLWDVRSQQVGPMLGWCASRDGSTWLTLQHCTSAVQPAGGQPRHKQ